MKKVLIVFAVLFCAATVFAADNAINFNLVPMGVQISTSSIEGQEPVVSTYGIGAEVSYQRFLAYGLYAEAGLGWDSFVMPQDKPVFTNLMAFGGFGFDWQFAKDLKANVHVDIATDTLFYAKKASETITCKTGVGISAKANENLDLTASCDGIFGFARKGDAFYVNYRILPMIGVSYNF